MSRPVFAPPETGDALSGFFDAEAETYDAAHDAPSPAGHALRARLDAVLGVLRAVPPGEALDVGMGPGRLVAALAAAGWTVSGLDASPAMVQAARARVPVARERLVVGELERLPFGDDAFDAVVATGVLEYASDVERAVGELTRVLRPGGVAVVSVANASSPASLWLTRCYYPAVRLAKGIVPAARPAPRPVPPPSRRSFEAALAAGGFRTVSRRPVAPVVLLAPLDRLAPRASLALSRRLASRGGAPARVLATQVVYSLAPI